MSAQRWIRDGRFAAQNYSWAQCRYCGRAQDHDCPVVECMLCGTPQCFGNGSGNGRCAVCYHGYLPGWSRGYSAASARHCGYAGCDDEAVGTARKRAICASHAERVKVNGMTLAEYVAKRIEERDNHAGSMTWKLVS